MTVGTPNFSSAYFCRIQALVAARRRRSAVLMSRLMSARIFSHHRVGFRVHRRGVQRIVAVHHAQEAGRLLEGLVAQARHFLQRRARGERALACRGSRRCFAPRCVDRPDTRASSGADAVFTSTPTAFTQSSTTASSWRASSVCDTSCWYWPTPIDFGSIFTSSASGSCRRRAIDTAPRIDTSRSGNSCATRIPRPNTPTRRLRTPRSWSASGSGMLLDQVAAPVCPFRATGGAVADRDQVNRSAWRTARPACAMRAVPVVARRVRVDGGGVDHLAGGVDHRHFARRCAGPGRGPWWRAGRPARPAAGRSGCGRRR